VKKGLDWKRFRGYYKDSSGNVTDNDTEIDTEIDTGNGSEI